MTELGFTIINILLLLTNLGVLGCSIKLYTDQTKQGLLKRLDK